MKRLIAAGMLAAVLCLTGCSNSDAQKPEESAASAAEKCGEDGLSIITEDVDAVYCDTLRTYFTAIEQKDFDAYCKTMYPPYMESYTEYLKTQDTTPEENFDKLCKRFDEDGYESWKLTSLHLAYYPEEKLDLDGFFDAFKDAGIIDDKFIEACKQEAEEIRDIQFSLQALYESDEEPVTVVSGNEIMMVKTKDGTYLFG